jgi:hypothetical protein
MKKSQLKKLIKEEYNRFILTEDIAKKLSKEIDKAIAKIDDNMSYVDFAKAIAFELKNQYGSHNFKPFIDALKKELS